MIRLTFSLWFLKVPSSESTGLLAYFGTERNNVNVYLKETKRHKLALPGVTTLYP